MSMKPSKRRQKRLNTNEDELEIHDKSTSPKKIDEQNTITDKTEEIVGIIAIEEQRETKVDETEGQNGHDIQEHAQNGDHHEKNGVHDESEDKLDQPEKSIDNQDSEVLIIVDSDEMDLKLAVEHEPEHEPEEQEHEKSPVLTGMTTRSQKSSPKVDTTENDIDENISNEVPVIVTEIEEEKTNESITSDKQDDKTETENEDKDTTNASTYVNLGNETTRNVDITNVAEDTVSNSFAEMNKDMSYGQALRTLSGRRTLRRDSPFVMRFKTNDKDTIDARRSYIPHISSVKRKATVEIPEEPKRFKDEDSPGIFSYISSPITSFRNKMSRSELPSSTPKLMSYNKYAQGSNIINDMSKIDLEENPEPKKWCSIM